MNINSWSIDNSDRIKWHHTHKTVPNKSGASLNVRNIRTCTYMCMMQAHIITNNHTNKHAHSNNSPSPHMRILGSTFMRFFVVVCVYSYMSCRRLAIVILVCCFCICISLRALFYFHLSSTELKIYKYTCIHMHMVFACRQIQSRANIFGDFWRNRASGDQHFVVADASSWPSSGHYSYVFLGLFFCVRIRERKRERDSAQAISSCVWVFFYVVHFVMSAWVCLHTQKKNREWEKVTSCCSCGLVLI